MPATANVLSGLGPKLEAAGYTVTVNMGLPAGSLSGYEQIWDIGFTGMLPLSAADRAAYVGYLAGGGSLVLIGERPLGSFANRDNDIIQLISEAGGGTVAVTDPDDLSTQNVRDPFRLPNPVSSVVFRRPGFAAGMGTGSAITTDGANSTAIGFTQGALSAAPNGTLIVIFDSNFLEAVVDADSEAFANNLINYLRAPSPIGQVPAPPSLILVLLGGAGLAWRQIRRRRQTRAAA